MAKRAESNRPFHGEDILTNERLRRIHLERAAAVLARTAQLSARGVGLTPFLEIGAGSVQRSIALMNTHSIDGVATDISTQSLRDAPQVLRLLGGTRMPMRVSCDAQHLPFLSDSFRFVFAYQTLHHFENPVGVFAEVHRVLGHDGLFLFDEEPMDSTVRRWLRGQRMLSEPRTRLQSIAERLGVEKVFWDDGAHERALGMTEARFDAELWRQCLLDRLEIVELEINRKLKLRPDLLGGGIGAWLVGLIGGNVRGLCRKIGGVPAPLDFRSRLMCLDCEAAPLVRGMDQLACAACGRVYPVEDGIARLLPLDLEQVLYPPHLLEPDLRRTP